MSKNKINAKREAYAKKQEDNTNKGKVCIFPCNHYYVNHFAVHDT